MQNKLTQEERDEIRKEFIKDFCVIRPYRDTDLVYFKGICDKNFNLVPTAKSIMEWYEEVIEERLRARDVLWKERDKKMFFYYKSVFKDGFEDGYPAEWDEFFNDK